VRQNYYIADNAVRSLFLMAGRGLAQTVAAANPLPVVTAITADFDRFRAGEIFNDYCRLYSGAECYA